MDQSSRPENNLYNWCVGISLSFFLLFLFVIALVPEKKDSNPELEAQAIADALHMLSGDKEFQSKLADILKTINTPMEENSTEVRKEFEIPPKESEYPGKGSVWVFYIRNNRDSSITEISADWWWGSGTVMDDYRLEKSYKMDPPVVAGEEAFLDIDPVATRIIIGGRNPVSVGNPFPAVTRVKYADGSVEVRRGWNYSAIKGLRDEAAERAVSVLENSRKELAISQYYPYTNKYGFRIPPPQIMRLINDATGDVLFHSFP